MGGHELRNPETGLATATTQTELDAALADSRVRQVLIARNLAGAGCEVAGGVTPVYVDTGRVTTRGSTEIIASGDAYILAEAGAVVSVTGEATVLARGDARVSASDHALVVAQGSAYVFAIDDAVVHAGDQVVVDAFWHAKAYLRDNATIVAGDQVKVVAFGRAEVEAHDAVEVFAADEVRVAAHEHALVVVLGDAVTLSTVEAGVIVRNLSGGLTCGP